MKAERLLHIFGGAEGYVGDGKYIVDCVVAKVGRRYLTRWEGWDDSHNTLETKSNLPAEVIEEYELKQTALGKAIAKPPKAPREPFTRELTTHQSEEVKELRIADAAELLDVIGIDASGRMARQFRPAAELKVFSARPASCTIATTDHSRRLRLAGRASVELYLTLIAESIGHGQTLFGSVIPHGLRQRTLLNFGNHHSCVRPRPDREFATNL